MAAAASSMSINSRTCYCKKEAPLRIAKTESNRGQKFYGCGNFFVKGEAPCNYFEWAVGDEDETRKSNIDYKSYCEALFEGRNKELMAEVERLKDDIEMEKNLKTEYKIKYELLIFKIRFLLVFFFAFGVYYLLV
ncbi:hypothetical protein OROHE_012860 [Orobanche hederae]